jgi:CheY-like chemotaxis protein
MATILYIEDHPPAQFLMQAVIHEMTDHTLHMGSSGAEAVQMAQQVTPDLYIVDLDLPDTDGLTLAQQLYSIHPAPIILVSAYAEAIKADELAHIIRFYLAKPLDPENVADIIQRALAR